MILTPEELALFSKILSFFVANGGSDIADTDPEAVAALFDRVDAATED